ncbi:Crp/Fnr family transcriptional regulator [Sphingomonas sp.]|uniref:Crp/Fnr family transcriptional regulator n=1 Tax=Sphingomonas sp. TaxID=28214 RepID=UPI001B29FD03|nr:Crp/Fnr family transcriptional regulator [Sphingomonas sp.]MBO9713293.1 Crp/Fnr family transcriptional regulator [Sphingomonas sp.]
MRYDPANDGCPPDRCAACAARGTSVCSTLADAELGELHAIGRRRTLPEGQVVISAGDPAAICANLVSGVLKVVRDDPEGRTQIVGLLFPGDLVGELFVDQATDTVVALSPVDLCVYPRRALEDVLDRHPAALRLLLRRALATLAETHKWMLMLGRRQAPEKVAAFLLDMERRVGGGGEYLLPMGRAAIGEVLGLTIETVSRQMTAMKRAGLIALPGGRRVRLLDRGALARIAG